MKKILIVGVSNTVGGVETLFRGLFEKKSEVFDISFLSFDKECAFSDTYRKNGYKIYVLPSRRSNPIMFRRRVKEFFLRHSDFDYIWVNTSSTSMYQFQYYGKRYTKAKIITHSHGTKFECTSGKLYYWGNKVFSILNKRKVLKNTDLFFACSEKAGTALFGASKASDIIVIKNGIDTEKFKYNDQYNLEIRNEFNISQQTYIVGMIGRLETLKNPIKALEIFYDITKKYDNAVFFVVGDGKLKRELINRANQLNLSEKVYFLGLRSDVYKILSAINILIMPSLSEGLPLTAIEAQASGCPCLLSNEITTEVKVSDIVSFIPLKDNALWVEAATEYFNRDTLQRNCYVDKVKYYKYDKKDTLQYIEKLLGDL